MNRLTSHARLTCGSSHGAIGLLLALVHGLAPAAPAGAAQTSAAGATKPALVTPERATQTSAGGATKPALAAPERTAQSGAAKAPSVAPERTAQSGAPTPNSGNRKARPVAPDEAPAERGVVAGLRCSGQAARPATMTLLIGKSTLMRLPEPVLHRSVGNARIAQAMLVAPDTLYLLGIDVGTTNMIIQGKSGACSVIDMKVEMDPAAVQATLAAALPEEKNIKVLTAAGTLVLSGTVSDAAALARAVELATAYVRKPLRALIQKGDDAGTPGTQVSKGEEDTPPELRVVNMLSVSAPQQVMLEVKIAEVSKSLLENLEGGFTWGTSWGSWGAAVVANFLTGTANGGVGAVKDNGNRLRLNAQKQDGLVRILAEPNVMAVSGQEGSFLAGGRIFIPVAQDNNKITLEEKEFGVGLRFTPTVLSGGRINLRVAPEVSEVSREGIGITATGFTGGAVLPLITTRRASTTVQLYDGQSFAIGGLIKNNMIANLKGLPGIGEVPVLGALFRSTDYQQDRTELVFVVTARLVKPLPQDYTLPTDNVTIPGRGKILLGGRLEGGPARVRAGAHGAPADASAGQAPGAEATPAAPGAAASPEASAQAQASGFELK